MEPNADAGAPEAGCHRVKIVRHLSNMDSYFCVLLENTFRFQFKGRGFNVCDASGFWASYSSFGSGHRLGCGGPSSASVGNGLPLVP